MTCHIISVEAVNAARVAREFRRNCLTILTSWEKVLWKIDARLQTFATLSDPKLFAEAVQNLAVARQNIVEAMITVQALQIESRIAALQKQQPRSGGQAG